MPIIPLTVREIPVGDHEFVMARPVAGTWSDFDNTTNRTPREELRPCMVKGHGTSQAIYVIGSQYAHALDKFEIFV